MIRRIYEVKTGSKTVLVNDEELKDLLALHPEAEVRIFCASEVKEEKREKR